MIYSSKLTTCGVLEDGETVRLDFLDETGIPVSLQFPLEQVEALIMMLPHLLAHAMKVHTSSEETHFAFPLGKWLIESSRDQTCLIVTLNTADGFQVSFSVPFDTACALGWTLSYKANQTIRSRKVDDESVARRRVQLN